MQFIVDEVDDARERDADRQQHHDLVGQDVEIQAAMFAQIEHDGENDADERAVEGHAALPNGDEIERVRKILRQIVLRDDVGNDEADPASDQHADERVHEKILNLVGGQTQAPPAGRPIHPQKHANEPDEIRQSVPVHGERSKPKRNRIDVRVDKPMGHRPKVRRPARDLRAAAEPATRREPLDSGSREAVHPQLNIATAFLAGLLSFISPCVLPLIPAYLSFLTGSSLEELKAERDASQRLRVLLHAVAFIAGFTLVFMLVGLSAGAVGSVFRDYKDWVARIGGIVIIVLGLNMIGIFKIPFLAMDKRLQVRSANRSLVASFLVGLGFAAGWSPCIGPILSGIILLAAQEQIGAAAFLLFVYSMGLAIPFLLTAAAITQALGVLNRIKRFLGPIEIGAGAFLVASGLVLLTGSFTRIAGFFYQYVKPPSL